MTGKVFITNTRLIKIQTGFFSDIFFPQYRHMYTTNDGTHFIEGVTLLDYPLYDALNTFTCLSNGITYAYSDRSDSAKAAYKRKHG